MTILLCSCVETVVVGTVAGGLFIANSNNLNDTETHQKNNSSNEKEIKKTIKNFFKSEGSEYRNINIKIFEGRILLTGYVKDAKYKKFATDNVINLYPKNEVIDEITILEANKKINNFNDYIISQKVSFRMRKIENIKKPNYKFNVTNSKVIIIGKSNNKEQMNQITNIISRTKGVDKVISYIQY